MLVTSQAREESHKRIDQLPDYLFHSCQLQNYINIKHDIFIVFFLIYISIARLYELYGPIFRSILNLQVSDFLKGHCHDTRMRRFMYI